LEFSRADPRTGRLAVAGPAGSNGVADGIGPLEAGGTCATEAKGEGWAVGSAEPTGDEDGDVVALPHAATCSPTTIDIASLASEVRISVGPPDVRLRRRLIRSLAARVSPPRHTTDI
jgi:hypothetical protein